MARRKAHWETHYAYVLDLMKSSPIFEMRRKELWAAFVGVKVDENKDWIEAFQSALDDTPRLAVSGSDAHAFADYGKFQWERQRGSRPIPRFSDWFRRSRNRQSAHLSGTDPRN